ncbi:MULTISPECIES: hypothetical protein [unclassified Lysobacter]
MKLLDCALITLLAGMAGSVSAQEAGVVDSDVAAGTVVCGDESCRGDDDVLLFQLRTRGLDEPATHGTDLHSSSNALEPDRRVEIGLQQPGKATVAGKFTMTLPNGGIIWATEDPTLGQPELSISAPSMVAFDGRRITEPVAFFVRSNYPSFIERYELTLYRAADGDLIDPIAQLPIDVAAVSNMDWNGELPSRFKHRAGDELVYVLRAYDKDGRFDETQPRTLQLVTPEEAARGASMIRDNVEKSLGSAMTTEQAQMQSLVDSVFAANGLRQQNIPIHGSRIRIQGRDLPDGYALKINGDTYPVDMERKFVAEFLAPVGNHPFALELQKGTDNTLKQTLDVEVSGKYLFAVALADITVSENNISGSTTPFDNDRRYQDDILSDGRLAFYGKGKFAGKYLVTAQADTTQRDLKHLFSGFTNADPQDIFRRLDPDMYYPVYGDDSTTYRDVDTMGRFYLRADWDKNQALWGNYGVGFTGTEYAQYVRSLYGAALDWRSMGNNAWGDPGSQLRVFASEAQTSPGHSEFIGTGGSLYYLKHTDVLPGSDVVVLEVRDLTTGRVENRIDLVRGADYEIDELQGRLLLTRPLAQVTLENSPTLTRDAPLDGLEQRLMVDYEWVPSGFDSDQVTAGFRGKHWFGDHVAIGATHVDENRAGDDYTLAGVDLTLQAGKGTYLKLEHSQTEATGAPVFFSDNGGFTFTQLNPVGPREGEASAAEARLNFKELGITEQDWSTGAWWRRVDAGYSVSRHDIGSQIEEYGAELIGQINPSLGIYTRASRAERGAEALTQAQLTAEWRINDDSTLSGEVRRVNEDRVTGDISGVLGALKYSQRVGTALELYGTGQLTLDDDGGKYAANDALIVGGKYLFGDLSTVGAEVSTGDRGDAAQVNAEYRIDPDHSLYGAYTHSTDRTEYDPLFNANRQNGWTLGQRWRLSNQVNMFNESQFLKTPSASGLAHTFGMDFYPAQGWNLGFTLQDGDLTNADGDNVDRRAVSVSGGRSSPGTDWQTKLEWRRDTGAEQREQWVTTNRLMHKVNDSLSLAARVNYSETTDKLDVQAGARFAEGNLGFAYRPWNSTRWGLFGRYTYLYDLSTLGQVGGADYDQRSQVLSLEGVYKRDQHWEFAAKLARREGEVRYGRGTGAWADSATTFAAGQIRYELIQQWHGLAEYRWLDVDNGGTRQGWLVGLDRDLNRHFRLGVGYNFTDFSDDLTNFDYDHKGWFINLVGSY